MRRFLTSALLLLATSVYAEVLPFNVEIGYRWYSINGNEAVYRTQINERGGLLVRTFSLNTPELRIDSTDFGIGPSSMLRIETRNSDLYRVRIGYRKMDAFSALPTFANPLLTQGIVAGQHTLDRTRSLFDIDLDIFPGRSITPFVGYSYNRNSGPGQTTYFAGQDEFRLLQDLKENDRELRAGAEFSFASVYGQVTQGWRQFRGTEQLTLAPGAGNGNNTIPIFGTTITADQISRYSRSSVDTPFTNAFVAAQATKRVKLIANYNRFSSSSDGNGSEGLTGLFVSFPLGSSFTGVTETASGRAKNRTWRGGGRAEINLRDGIDFLAGYQREHREIDGASLIDTLYLQTVAFGTTDKKDLETILNSSNSLGRNETVWNAGISARAFGPFAVRTEFRQTQQDFSISPDLSEIVVPGSQGGDFKRRIRTFDTGATYAKAGFTLGASWKSDRANTPVFRTDFLDRDRYRARAGWTSKQRKLAFGVTAEQTNQNNESEIGFNGKLRQYTGDVEVVPVAVLRLRGSVSQYRADTDIFFRQPSNFTVDTSIHKENGKSREGGFTLLFKRGTLDAGYTRFKNCCNISFQIDRYRVRATFDLKAKTGIAAEWSKDKYNENSALFSNFDANRFGLYLRLTP